MSLTGQLDDVAIVDVLQILGVSGKTGFLRVTQEGRSAEIAFSKGCIVSARILPHLVFMTDYLVERGKLTLEILQDALRLQRQLNEAGKPIGGILMDMGVVTATDIEAAMGHYIQTIIDEVRKWSHGEFAFELGETEAATYHGFVPVEVPITVELKPQELLIRAVHTIGDSEGAETPGDRQSRPQRPVLLLSTDSLMRQGLKEELRSPYTLQVIDSVADAERLFEGAKDAAHLLVVDVDRQAAVTHATDAVRGVAQLRAQCPQLAIVSFGDSDPELVAQLVEVGVQAHLPRPPDGVDEDARALRSFVSAVGRVVNQAMARPGTSGRDRWLWHAWMADLCADADILRRSSHSSAVSLEVLQVLARRLQRTMLFLVGDGDLLGVGGVGIPYTPAEMAKKADAFRLDLVARSVVAKALSDRKAVAVPFVSGDPVLGPMVALIGAPARAESLLLPLVVENRTIGIIYGDNGDRDTALPPAESLAVIVELAGLWIEILSLRRKLLVSR